VNPLHSQQDNPNAKRHHFGSGPDSKHCVTYRQGRKERGPEDEYLISSNKNKSKPNPQRQKNK
jgi:hypothetical protein